MGPAVPSKRFGIDAGHPIATIDDYRINGKESLKPAKFFINNDTIYHSMWDNVESLFEGENRRYDIIMDKSSCNAYIANGLVVQARETRIYPGYDYI